MRPKLKPGEALRFPAHRRDPVSGVSTRFQSEFHARHYYALATKYFLSFKEIFLMAAQLLQHYDVLQDNLEEREKEGKADAELLRKLRLPADELIAIWKRSREALLWLGECVPERKERIKAAVAEQEQVMTALLERYKRKEREH